MEKSFLCIQQIGLPWLDGNRDENNISLSTFEKLKGKG